MNFIRYLLRSLNYIIRYQGTLLLLLLFFSRQENNCCVGWFENQTQAETRRTETFAGNNLLICFLFLFYNTPPKRFYTFHPNLNKCVCVSMCVFVCMCVWVCLNVLLSFSQQSFFLVDFIPFLKDYKCISSFFE